MDPSPSAQKVPQHPFAENCWLRSATSPWSSSPFSRSRQGQGFVIIHRVFLFLLLLSLSLSFSLSFALPFAFFKAFSGQGIQFFSKICTPFLLILRISTRTLGHIAKWICSCPQNLFQSPLCPYIRTRPTCQDIHARRLCRRQCGPAALCLSTSYQLPAGWATFHAFSSFLLSTGFWDAAKNKVTRLFDAPWRHVTSDIGVV